RRNARPGARNGHRPCAARSRQSLLSTAASGPIWKGAARSGWPVEPGKVDARDRLCSDIPAYASVRAPRGGGRGRARRDVGALGPLRHGGVLRNDRRWDCRLLVTLPEAKGNPTCPPATAVFL